MRERPWRGLLLWALLVMLGCTADPELAVAQVEDLGAFSQPSDVVVGRDGVSAGLKDGRLLWTFGDTFVRAPNPADGSNVVSATGGWSTKDMPLQLDEPVDDAGVPHQLIPFTDEEVAQNRADVLNGWALWPGEPLDTGGEGLLVLFQRIKRTNGSGFDAVALGTARVAVGSTEAVRAPGYLFERPSPDAGTPIFGGSGVSEVDGTAYFFACEPVAPLNLGCKVARVPVARADQRDAFEFYDGDGWQKDASKAQVVIDQVGGGLSLSFNRYLNRYLAVTSGVFDNRVYLRTAARVEGPWSAPVAVNPGDGGILPPGDPQAYDYGAQEQPELSSPEGREIVISYSRPLGNFRGEVRLARLHLR